VHEQPVITFKDGDKEILYAIANQHCAWRVKSIYDKEPDTIAWIRGMRKGDIFIDVGANMGIYSMFAGAYGLKVFAFEPEADNYCLLCRSIRFNDFDITAYCVALSDETKYDYLYLSGYLPGGSCHTFGQNLDHRLEERQREFKQGCISIPLDRFHIVPSSVLYADGRTDDQEVHVKIDVDGLEHKVVSGAVETIRQAKSVLCEINTALPEHKRLIGWMQEFGFKHDPAQVERAQRKDGTFKGCGNWIFFK
jgi:FkbM family methyltransferase